MSHGKISNQRLQISLAYTKQTNKTPPTKLKATQITPNPNPNLNNKGNTRRRPYPPNFSKTPAKIIEPETGASA
jgi:hypothetical protein